MHLLFVHLYSRSFRYYLVILVENVSVTLTLVEIDLLMPTIVCTILDLPAGCK
jgi:hypothetical protein